MFIEENQDDLTLIDPSFLSQLPILENYLLDAGYDIKNVRRIILTHVHVDHAQAANAIKEISGANIFFCTNNLFYLSVSLDGLCLNSVT